MQTVPKNITVKMKPSDAQIIDQNLTNLSHMVGRRINKSALIRHILLTHTSLSSLYNLGFISFQELHESTNRFSSERIGKRLKH